MKRQKDYVSVECIEVVFKMINNPPQKHIFGEYCAYKKNATFLVLLTQRTTDPKHFCQRTT